MINGYTGAAYTSALSGFRKARFHVDVRGMRKVTTDQSLKLVWTSSGQFGSPGNPGLTGHMRVLIKE